MKLSAITNLMFLCLTVFKRRLCSSHEFINLGASHVGISGGFITVYRPDGTIASVFDNTGTSFGMGIINNESEEMDGPVGTANGGYNPGVVPVTSDTEGAWTVVFDFPNYATSSFDTLLNIQPWNRDVNQKLGNRVILAWDITVTQNAAGNAGGVAVEGRVYSNEYISILNKNGNLTSPTFYVLSVDGFQYQVDFMEADPFRFRISANSLGLIQVDAGLDGMPMYTPIYRSDQEVDFVRSADPVSWIVSQEYLYEPQAEDFGLFINHKVFFNLPDSNMPGTALTTDIYRNNTHQTWLYNELDFLQLDSLYFFGTNPEGEACNDPFYEFGEGGYFVTNTNIGGTVNIMIDINNNGVFDDSIDVTLIRRSESGLDSIYWDGFDGLGNIFAEIGDTFNLNYSGFIRFGEIHIPNTDVEDNPGGVTFELLNAPDTFPINILYFDHSDLTAVSGAVSGGGLPGNALPIPNPFTYGDANSIVMTGNFGNNNYLDQWVFNDLQLPISTSSPPVASIADSDVISCYAPQIILDGTGSSIGSEYTYIWTGPDIIDEETTLNPTVFSGGLYTLTVTDTISGCTATSNIVVEEDLIPPTAVVNAPEITCNNQEVQIDGTGSSVGLNFTYQWDGPGIVAGSNTLTPSANISGLYSIVITNAQNGCASLGLILLMEDVVPPIINVNIGSFNCINLTLELDATGSSVGNEYIYQWNGPGIVFGDNTLNPVINTSGNYTLSAINNINGCSSEMSLLADIPLELTAVLNQSVVSCVNQSESQAVANASGGTPPYQYAWNNGLIVNDSTATNLPTGTLSVTITDAEDCEIIETLTIEALPHATSNITGSWCEGDTLFIGNQTFSSDQPMGSVTLAGAAFNGCDSIIAVNLTIINDAITDFFQVLCSGEIIQFNGITFDQNNTDGLVVFDNAAANGCDSIVHVLLDFTDAIETNIQETICAGENYPFGNQLLTEANIYQDTIPNVDGCDSILILDLQVASLTALSLLPDAYVLDKETDDVALRILNNDTLPDVDWQLQLLTTATDIASLVIVDYFVEYTLEDKNYVGIDSFQYLVCQTSCANNCDTAWVFINLDAPCYREASGNIPNGFSPNDDGFNDAFDPLREFIKLDCPFDHSTVHLKIVNRWGEVVYEVFYDEILNTGWDGRQANNGRILPEATYYYILEIPLTEETKTYKGPINLLR